MQIRDRIKELRRVRASELRPSPSNWRTHPEQQREALRGVLAEVGYADALLVRELDDGSLELIDGHLRAETTPEAQVPVLVLDVDQSEAAKILATHDPLTAMATADAARLDELLRQLETDNQAVAEMLSELAQQYEIIPPEDEAPAEDQSSELRQQFQVLVICRSEAEQAQLLAQLTNEGYSCRSLIS